MPAQWGTPITCWNQQTEKCAEYKGLFQHKLAWSFSTKCSEYTHDSTLLSHVLAHWGDQALLVWRVSCAGKRARKTLAKEILTLKPHGCLLHQLPVLVPPTDRTTDLLGSINPTLFYPGTNSTFSLSSSALFLPLSISFCLHSAYL